MNAFHFDAVFYYTSNLERSIRFYRDVLGFKLVSRDIVARFNIDAVLFELVPTSDKSEFTAKGNARLCLRVENVAAALKQLESNGVRVSPAADKGVGVLGRFQDPDGNELCLWEYRNA